MADIKNIRIQKSTYQFGVKKRYSSEFKYKKVVKTPLKKIQEAIAAWRKPKGKIVLEDAEEDQSTTMALERKVTKKEKTPLLSPKLIMKAGGALMLFILLMATVVLFFQSNVYSQEIVINPVSIQSFSVDVEGYDLLTASSEEQPRYPYHTAFVRLSFQGEGAGEIPVELEAYNSVVPSSIYILRSYRYQAETYPEFISTLKTNLSAWGIPVNEIGMEELSSLPSQSLVIVPSGYIPEQMLTGQDSRLTSLLARGVTVLYVGQPFFRMYGTQGAVVSANPAALDPMRVSFDEVTPISSTTGFNLKSPLYSIGGATLVWGSVSALSYEQGYLIALPQTLDGGWESGQDAAEDVYSLIVQMPWLKPIGTASETATVGGNATLIELFTSTFEGDNKYVRVYGFNPETGLGFSKVLFIQKSTNGELYTQGHDIKPAGLGSTKMDIMAELNEAGGEERIFFTVTQMLTEVDREPIATTKVALNSRPTFPYEFVLASGNYILNVVDGDGNEYARSYMRVGNLIIQPGQHSFSSDIYRYSFYLDGEPIQVSGSVYVDDHTENKMDFENVQEVEIEAAQLAGGPISANEDHTFTFELGEFTYEDTIRKTSARSLFDSPFIMGAVVIGVIALGVGFLFARKGVTMYGLDIPDFPPQSTKKIPMKKEKLIEIFQDINERYKWKATPLTLSEIKSGFRGILHEGKPIFISDYNLEYLLMRLMGMNLVKRELKYYGLTSWEEETGQTVRHLAFFRKLRDICINNAIPFTPLGKSKEYDSKITIIGQDIYVHLYDDPGRIIPDALASLKNGLNIIIFEEQAEKSEFYEYLSSGYAGGTTLKLEVQAGSVLLKTWDEFEEMVKEMKV